MANSTEYDVIINIITGHLERATKELKGMAGAVDGVSKANKAAAESGRKNNDVINGGVGSANNATRGFSKLKDSINGSNGLVAAYATLATNAFAVGAAFTALQKAAQTEQVFKGLEEQGVRTGVTLSTVSKNIQQITNYSISAADAMTAVAQVSAAGFSTKTSEDLAKAAANSAAALGRNIPDALDRFIKGTTKLEPELLDEMGIMVKLDQASSTYAQSLGKLPSQLTATEKRTAYLNAVLAESDKKFRGMADAAEPNAYDQLSASFKNLTTTTLNWVNNNGAEEFVKSLANNTGLLTATLILFGSTIVKQIIPGLYGMAAAAATSAEALAKQAAAQHLTVLEAEKEAAASRVSAIEQARTLVVVEKNSAAYKAYAQALKDGTETEAQKTTVLRGLTSQTRKLEEANKRLDAIQNKTEDELKKIETNKLLIETYKDQKKVILDLAAAEEAAQKGTEAAQAGIAAAKRKEDITKKASEAHTSFAVGLEKAGSGDILGAFGSIKEGLGSLQESYRKASEANGSLVSRIKSGFDTVKGSILGAITSLYGFITASNGMSRFDTIITALSGLWFRFSSIIAASGGIINTIKLAFIGLTWSIKAIGTAILSAIPVIGELFFAFEMIMEYGPKIYETIKNLFRSDDQKKEAERIAGLEKAAKDAEEKTKKAVDDLSASRDNATKVAARYHDIMKSTTADYAMQQAAILATSNAMVELVDRYKQVQKAKEEEAAAKTAITATATTTASLDQIGIKVDPAIKNSEAYKTASSIYALGNNKVNSSFINLLKTTKNLKEEDISKWLENTGEDQKRLADATTGTTESFRSLDSAAQAFAKSIVPSTSYDSFIDKITEAKNNVDALKKSTQIGGDMSKFGAQLANDMNTPAIQGLLPKSALQEQTNFLVEQEHRRILERRAIEGSTSAQDELNDSAARFSKQQEHIGEVLSKGLDTSRDHLLALQTQERTIQSTINLENVRYAAFSRFAGQTKESALAQDEHENKLKDLENQKLKLQLTVIDSQIAAVKIQETQLELQKQKVLKEKESLKIQAEAYRLTIAQGQLQIGKRPDTPERAIGGKTRLPHNTAEQQEWDRRNEGLTKASEQLALLEKYITEDDTALAKIQKQEAELKAATAEQVRSFVDARKVISDSMKANEESKLKSWEIIDRSQILDLKIALEMSGKVLEQQQTIADISKIKTNSENKYTQALVAQADYSSVELKNQLHSYDIQKKGALELSAAELKRRKDAVDNMKNASAVQAAMLQAEYKLAKQNYDIDLKSYELGRAKLIVTAQQQLLDQASLNPLKEGLEIQQKSLEIINAQYDAQQKLIDSKAEGRKLDAQIAAAKLGLQMDPELTKKMEETAAKESLRIAEEQLQTKIEGIKLEYALLEAQKVSTMIELSMQKKILETKLRASQGGKLTKDQETALNQITTSINELGKYSYDAIRNIAIETAKSDVANKRKTVELLGASSALGDAADNLLSRVLLSIDTAKRIETEGDIGDKASSSTLAAGIFAPIKTVIPDMGKVLTDGLDKVEGTTKSLEEIFALQTDKLSTSLDDLTKTLQAISPDIVSRLKTNEATVKETLGLNNKMNLGTITSKSGVTAQIRKDLVPAFQGFINDLEATGYKIATLSGFREGATVKGKGGIDTGRASGHSAAATLDINASQNPHTWPGDKAFGKTDMPANVSEIAKKWGLGWGGDWKNSKDTMHFSSLLSEGGSLVKSLVALTEATNKATVTKQQDIKVEAPTRQPFDEKIPVTKDSSPFKTTSGPFDFGIDISSITDNLKSDLQASLDSMREDMAKESDKRIGVNAGTTVNTDKFLQNFGYQKFGSSTDITDPTSVSDAGFSKGGLEKLDSFKSDVTKQADDLQQTLYDKFFGGGKLQSMTAEEAKKATETFRKEYADKIGPIAQDAYAKAFPAAGIADKVGEFWDAADARTQPFLDNLKKLGPDGELVATVYQGFKSMSKGVTNFAKDVEAHGISLQNVATLANTVLSTIQSVTESASKAKVAGIDKEIAAEQKRDGKSAESVAKIAALEKKKDDIQRKQFNINKKISMAQAVIATATSIAEALKMGPIVGPIMAGLIGAMGIAQIAIISGTQYESSLTPKAPEMPSTLTIGKRDSSVDLAKGPNANAGGELAYLRGGSGVGTNATNYRTVGSAYGGELMRGYGNRGFVVGEKGPEVITPETPISVTPANDVGGAAPINANISIHALDSHGVQDILVSQKGNIIKMLREAANASGQRFMENVNTNVYTRPSVNKL